jgi:fatty-acyl-CoA synthase
MRLEGSMQHDHPLTIKHMLDRTRYEDPSGDDKFDDGWLRTGDIAAIDELGYIRLTDRAKDVIKSGGEWISPVELENELMGHPGVAEAA